MSDCHEVLYRSSNDTDIRRLANGIVHDFNNALTAILSQASLALTKLPQDSPARAHVERAIRSTRQATDLTHQLLKFARHSEMALAQIDLNQAVLSSLDLLDAWLEPCIQISTELANDLWLILANQSQIQQIAMNLLVNATEAIVEGPGRIRVATSNCLLTDAEVGDYLSQDRLTPGRYVCLEIQDNDIGIERSVLHRVFEPSFTTKPAGNGIGLATTVAIVHTHKGGVQVRSTRGLGTTFRVLLPATEIDRPAVSSQAELSPIEILPDTILIIDDEQAVRDSLSDILELAGHNVLTAAHGEEGLAIFQRHHPYINIVLLDIRMAGLNGVETLQALRRIEPNLPIILSSGYSRAEISYPVDADRYASYIRKPYEVDELLALIDIYLESAPAS